MTKKYPIDFILDVSEYKLPINNFEIFENNNQLAFEIGFGEGEFLAELAKKNINWNYIGIEIKYSRFRKAARKIKKENLNNVRLLHIDAKIAVEQIFSQEIFDKVYINFPDPWPKDRHKKHRIINNEFLNDLLTIMKKNSILEFSSDHNDYIEHTLAHFEFNKNFINLYKPQGFVNSIKNRPITRFEKEFMQEGKTIYFLAFKRCN